MTMRMITKSLDFNTCIGIKDYGFFMKISLQLKILTPKEEVNSHKCMKWILRRRGFYT